jgi:triphosphoribosyl-dephospho-CoA synthase
MPPVPLSAGPLSIAQCASLACLLEATAPKPGNVHRGADFEDVCYLDFAVSGILIAPAIEAAAAGGRLGKSVVSAISATRASVATNTNLGTVLLIVPLAMVPREQPLNSGVVKVLEGLDAQDARDVYQAIRLAQPGGLGSVSEADVAATPPSDLVAAMRLAAGRDLVARQYVEGFAQVLGCVVPWLAEGLGHGWPLAECIVHTQLRLMSEFPDSLIARKCGASMAVQSAAMASAVLAAGTPGEESYRARLLDLDFWLRCDGHRRNPGTSADLLAAGLFAALRDGIIKLPLRFYG